MALAESDTTPAVENGVVAETAPLIMPDLDNTEDVEGFISALQTMRDKRGAKTLAKSLASLITLRKYETKHVQRAYKNLNTINGVRTPSQRMGDKSRSLRNTAEKFYASLNTAGLQQHCTLFGLQFDTYNSIKEVVDALVDKHLSMNES